MSLWYMFLDFLAYIIQIMKRWASPCTLGQFLEFSVKQTQSLYQLTMCQNLRKKCLTVRQKIFAEAHFPENKKMFFFKCVQNILLENDIKMKLN